MTISTVALPYFVILFILYLIERKNHKCLYATGKDNTHLLRSAYFILLIFSGLRGFVYTDFASYYPFYEMIGDLKDLPYVFLVKGWEPGFIIYTYLCKLLVPNYFAWNFISTAIDLSLLYVFLKRYSPNQLLSLMIFFVMGFTALEFNVLRNAKAIFIFLISIKYIEERNLLKYSFAILLAFMFHTSAIFYWPLYFILNKRIPKKILWVVFVAGLIILLFNIHILPESLINYMSFITEDSDRFSRLSEHLSNEGESKISIGMIERIITYLLVMKTYDNKMFQAKNRYIFSNMYVLFFIVWFYFSNMGTALQRFNYMFIPCYWILYPSWIECNRVNFPQGQMLISRKLAHNIRLFIIAFLFLRTMVMGDGNLKYENVLTGASTFEQRMEYLDRQWDR